MKKKKKSTRIKPFKRWVLVLESKRKLVPTSTTRRQLLQCGREKRVEFYRSMTKEQVKEKLLQSFPKLSLENPTFLKCDSSKRLVDVKMEGFPTGEEILDISSKESMYVLEEGPERETRFHFDFSVCK